MLNICVAIISLRKLNQSVIVPRMVRLKTGNFDDPRGKLLLTQANTAVQFVLGSNLRADVLVFVNRNSDEFIQ